MIDIHSPTKIVSSKVLRLKCQDKVVFGKGQGTKHGNKHNRHPLVSFSFLAKIVKKKTKKLLLWYKLMIFICCCPSALRGTAFCNLKYFWGLLLFLFCFKYMKSGSPENKSAEGDISHHLNPKSYDLQILYRCVHVGSIGIWTEGRPVHAQAHSSHILQCSCPWPLVALEIEPCAAGMCCGFLQDVHAHCFSVWSPRIKHHAFWFVQGQTSKTTSSNRRKKSWLLHRSQPAANPCAFAV